MIALNGQAAPGSPPRLRGIHHRSPSTGVRQRFTPAPAGNTLTCRPIFALPPVHPRACGEYLPAHPQMQDRVGSPPRLRGIRRRYGASCRRCRFTPAPAGNTREETRSWADTPVHPRACGEYHPPAIHCRSACGSPPRLRGIRARRLSLQGQRRFTPAPAGNTLEADALMIAFSVHPRACGEYTSIIAAISAPDGSPPRLRGIRLLADLLPPALRFTPAPAGNTGERSARASLSPVHPRACGEYWRPANWSPERSGSPPRLRGIRQRDRRERRRGRFTPAPAGNTRPERT